jgi:hypothetical protein
MGSSTETDGAHRLLLAYFLQKVAHVVAEHGIFFGTRGLITMAVFNQLLMDNLKDSFTSAVELNLEIKQIGSIIDEISAFLSTLDKLIGENFTAMHQDNF